MSNFNIKTTLPLFAVLMTATALNALMPLPVRKMDFASRAPASETAASYTDNSDSDGSEAPTVSCSIGDGGACTRTANAPSPQYYHAEAKVSAFQGTCTKQGVEIQHAFVVRMDVAGDKGPIFNCFDGQGQDFKASIDKISNQAFRDLVVKRRDRYYGTCNVTTTPANLVDCAINQIDSTPTDQANLRAAYFDLKIDSLIRQDFASNQEDKQGQGVALLTALVSKLKAQGFIDSNGTMTAKVQDSGTAYIVLSALSLSGKLLSAQSGNSLKAKGRALTANQVNQASNASANYFQGLNNVVQNYNFSDSSLVESLNSKISSDSTFISNLFTKLATNATSSTSASTGARGTPAVSGSSTQYLQFQGGTQVTSKVGDSTKTGAPVAARSGIVK